MGDDAKTLERGFDAIWMEMTVFSFERVRIDS